MITYWQAKLIEECNSCVIGLIRGGGGYVADKRPRLVFSTRSVNVLVSKGLLRETNRHGQKYISSTMEGLREMHKRLAKYHTERFKQLEQRMNATLPDPRRMK